MSFQTFADVTEHVIAYHRQANRFYRELTACIENDLCLLLVEDLARQQLDQAEALQHYFDTAEQKIFRTQLQFASSRDLWEAPEYKTSNGELSLQAIQKFMRTIDNTILEVYRQLQQEQLPPELTEIINRMTEQQAMMAKKHSFASQQLESI